MSKALPGPLAMEVRVVTPPAEKNILAEFQGSGLSKIANNFKAKPPYSDPFLAAQPIGQEAVGIGGGGGGRKLAETFEGLAPTNALNEGVYVGNIPDTVAEAVSIHPNAASTYRGK